MRSRTLSSSGSGLSLDCDKEPSRCPPWYRIVDGWAEGPVLSIWEKLSFGRFERRLHVGVGTPIEKQGMPAAGLGFQHLSNKDGVIAVGVGGNLAALDKAEAAVKQRRAMRTVRMGNVPEPVLQFGSKNPREVFLVFREKVHRKILRAAHRLEALGPVVHADENERRGEAQRRERIDRKTPGLAGSQAGRYHRHPRGKMSQNFPKSLR